jgi:hypothetical protein
LIRIAIFRVGTSPRKFWALGQAEQQTTTCQLNARTGFVQRVTDNLSRVTAMAYDACGNVLTATAMCGTGQAVTTTMAYESTFNQALTITDGLSHTTLSYDSARKLTSVCVCCGDERFDCVQHCRAACECYERWWDFAD